jgi:hypothetical protein
VAKKRFDALARTLISIASRRQLLRGLVAAGFGVDVARSPALVDARRKRKRKHKKKEKKATPNEFGCFEVGDPCKSEADCCSGICEGKKCRAHDTGTCNQKAPGTCEAGNPLETLCNGRTDCACLRTTADSNACAQLGTDACADCQKDADCAALGFPPGTACAPFAGDLACTGVCESGMVCTVPCGYTPPDPEPD